MATNCIVIEKKEIEKTKKPIEFIHLLASDGKSIMTSLTKPREYKNIELICKGYINTGKDLMFAYVNNRENGTLYIGYWNDGFVE